MRKSCLIRRREFACAMGASSLIGYIFKAVRACRLGFGGFFFGFFRLFIARTKRKMQSAISTKSITFCRNKPC